jgi:hypothetical protein
MSDFAKGGNDRFTSEGSLDNFFYGDAGGDMSGHAQGGNDIFTGNLLSGNTFYGDAGGTMSGQARGGDDLMVLPDSSGPFSSTNLAYGDALTMSGKVSAATIP